MDLAKESRTELLKKIYDEFIIKKQSIILSIENIESIEDLNSKFSLIITELNTLQTELSTNWDLLSKYDQKSIQNQIEEVYKLLEIKKESIKPKKKFMFKNRTQLRSGDNQVKQTIKEDSGDKLITNNIDCVDKKDTIIIRDETSKFLNLLLPSTAPNNAEEKADRSLELINIKNCILNFTLSSISTIHIKNISNSIILLSPLKNSCLIYNMKNCKLVVGCHQFRIHDSTNNSIYLHVSSIPIIENCNNLSFLKYPSLSLKSKIELTKYYSSLNQANNWEKVQDFNWIKSTKSPNFNLIKENEEEQGLIKELVDDLNKFEADELITKYIQNK